MDIEPERVLRSVRDPSVARALMQHELNGRVVDTSGAYYCLDQRKRQYRLQRGLLPSLGRVFWPHTDFRNIKRRPRPRSQKRLARKHARQREKKATGGGRFGGIVKGSRVHHEVKDFVLYDARAFQKTHRQVHAYTTRLLEAIVKLRHWTPLLPEFCIVDEALGIGTAVDLIAVDRAGDLVLLEFKTGYQDYWDAADGHMLHALALLPNTPRNRASLQVATAALFLNRRYQVPLARMHMYVMRIDDAQTQIVAVPRDLLEKLGDAIYSDLLRYNVKDP
jgi:hypothetical protein